MVVLAAGFLLAATATRRAALDTTELSAALVLP
jgi:hypothetical protein